MTDQGRLVAGRYELTEQIGRGGMGTVWLARDTLLDRTVAVKKLRVPSQADDEERALLYERTRREARSAARISHASVTVVHDVVEDEGLPCIVMEYVPSRSLADAVRERGPLAPEETARVGLAMAGALRAAHTAGVLHRDVKPANVLLAQDGERIVLTDFGIAAASDTTTLTRTGEFIGSVDYASPERVQGGEAGEASDAWGLGATLYEAVEGEPPFRQATWMETAFAMATDPPRPMKRAGTLEPLIEALLGKDPETRLTLESAAQWLTGLVGTASMPVRDDRTQAAPTVPHSVPSAQSWPVAGEATVWPDVTPEDSSARAAAPARTPTRVSAPDADAGPDAGRSPGAGSGTEAPAAPASAGAPTRTAVPGARAGDTEGEAGGAPERGTAKADGQRPGGGRKRGGRKRRAALWTLCAVVVAGAVAGGTLVARNRHAGPFAGNSPSVAKSPSPSGAPSSRPPVPEGHHRVQDPLGFSVDVPDGWRRVVRGNGTEADYLSPSGMRGLKFSVLDFADASPLRHWRQLEPEVRQKSPGYHRMRMNATRFQGQPAAIWEYRWQGQVRPFHVADLGFGKEGDTQYAIYLSAPDAEWQDAKPDFDAAVNSFRVTKH